MVIVFKTKYSQILETPMVLNKIYVTCGDQVFQIIYLLTLQIYKLLLNIFCKSVYFYVI